MVTKFQYPIAVAAAIFVVESILKFVVRRGRIKDDDWFTKLLFRVIVGGVIMWALGQRF